MRDETLPRWIELNRIGEDGMRVAGELPIEGLSRLRETLAAPASPATAQLRIMRDRSGAVTVVGEVAAELALECQRCLGVVAVPAGGDFHLLVVDSEAEAENLKEEVAVAREGRLDVHALLEDELLLALPVVARHDEEHRCHRETRHFGPAGEPRPQRENSFAKLAELKDKHRDDQ